ncbi:hypothetical protein [Emticicia sp. SJ17W-69]|uniref:hypothetical protein n=1 Tax=Emticicia sp. SJ17W-69 TaxID=3421657 RepID=UPI003EBCFAA6
MKEIKPLPFTKVSDKKWTFLYSFNLKTIRDIFIYVNRQPITKKELYEKMEQNIIKPPKKQWSDDKNKKKDRLKLEYLHASIFLGLISQDNNFLLSVNFDSFSKEKKNLIKENEKRDFSTEKQSLELNDIEKKEFLSIIFSYSRAKDYLWWFTNFETQEISDITVEYIQREGKPFYLMKDNTSKGARILHRTIDNKDWTIPYEEEKINKKGKLTLTNDYSRLVTFVLPSWFCELEVINRIPILKEFGFKKGNWEMHYPISLVEISLEEFEIFIKTTFGDNSKSYNAIWIPQIIYKTALKYRLPTEVIKKLIIRLFEEKRQEFTLERSSYQVLRYSAESQRRSDNFHQELFIIYNDFLRTYLTINNKKI